MKSLVVLYQNDDREKVEQQIVPLLKDHQVQAVVLEDEQLPELSADSLVITWLSDRALKRLMNDERTASWQWGLLPHPDMGQAKLGFGIANKIEQALEDILSPQEASTIDLMYCNDKLVFNSVVIGDTYTLKPARMPEDSWLMRLRRFARLLPNLSELTLKPFRLVTKKEKVIDTAALGIVVVEHGKNSPLTRRVLDNTSLSDGKLNALVLAPRSVFDLLYFLFSSVFLPSTSNSKLPDFIGYIKTESLTLTGSSQKPIKYSLDGISHGAEELTLYIKPQSARLFMGRHVKTESDEQPSDKETVRLQNLPVGEAKTVLVSYPMPWIHHASSDEFRDLFQNLRENARPSETYLTLMVLSTLLATFGLFASSAPVIIGAMILAPLMTPIISLAMGLLRQEEKMIKECLRTLAVGIGLSVLCAMILAMLTPLQTINPEIGARLKPTLLDLGVAVISGIAGAYANARTEVAKSLAGVAIAVALVPPLAVTGIGLGWLDWSVFSGAALLFLTNLAGIVLAAVITFLALGYSPFKRAKQGLMLSLVMVAFVSVPLALGFRQMVIEHNIVRMLNGWQVEEVELRDVNVSLGDPVRIRTRLASPAPLQEEQLDGIKLAIEQRIDRKVQLEAVVALVR
ncbi:MAG TPA: TIGR00341 family protein [Pseudomonadales bacterium]